MFKLESIENDYIRIIKVYPYKQVPSWGRGSMLDLESQGPIPIGGKYHILFLSFVTWIYTILPDLTE